MVITAMTMVIQPVFIRINHIAMAIDTVATVKVMVITTGAGINPKIRFQQKNYMEWFLKSANRCQSNNQFNATDYGWLVQIKTESKGDIVYLLNSYNYMFYIYLLMSSAIDQDHSISHL